MTRADEQRMTGRRSSGRGCSRYAPSRAERRSLTKPYVVDLYPDPPNKSVPEVLGTSQGSARQHCFFGEKKRLSLARASQQTICLALCHCRRSADNASDLDIHRGDARDLYIIR